MEDDSTEKEEELQQATPEEETPTKPMQLEQLQQQQQQQQQPFKPLSMTAAVLRYTMLQNCMQCRTEEGGGENRDYLDPF